MPRTVHSASSFDSSLRHHRGSAREQVVAVDVACCGGTGCASVRRNGSRVTPTPDLRAYRRCGVLGQDLSGFPDLLKVCRATK
jgi:hypothetical protein